MTPDPQSPDRRTLMKAIGAGAVLSAFGGTTAARETDAAEATADLHQVDDGVDPESGGSVHEVRTLTQGPPTNQARPADFFYEPTGLHVQPGDVVRFVFETPDHNVVSYHPAFGMRRRVPRGVPPISSPLLGWHPGSVSGDRVDPPGAMEGGSDGQGDGGDGNDGNDANGPVPDTWLLGVETPGVYDFLCSPHELFGMAMRVVVGDDTEAPFEVSDPEALPDPRVGPVELARETLTDPALDPENIVDQGAVSWADREGSQTGESEQQE